MKANRAYRLIVTRGGRGPAWLAGTDRVDHVEIVDIASGEVCLFWDRTARDAVRLSRELKADLAGLEYAEFFAKWSARADEPLPAVLGEY
jgi:hypothetical protein